MTAQPTPETTGDDRQSHDFDSQKELHKQIRNDSLFSANPCLRYSVLRQPLAYYAQHSDNLTRSNFKMILWALDLRSYLQLSMPIYCFSLICFILSHLLGHLMTNIRPRMRTRSIDSLMTSDL